MLVDFWGLSCSSCLRDMPSLIKFYEDHASQRSQFEIVSICIDTEGEIKSIADLDRRLQPIVDHVWQKPLPFPILLDPTFTTWERYGLPGLGTRFSSTHRETWSRVTRRCSPRNSNDAEFRSSVGHAVHADSR